MSDYGFWYPRGTTNSEYGKFAYNSNLQGQPNQSGGQNAQWNGQHGYQNAQNYYQGHQHHPSCPNSTGQWMQQGSWNPNESGAGESGQTFTVHVGEEAATAALGGKANFQTHFSAPQNPCVSEHGAGGGLQYQQQQTQEQGAQAQNQMYGTMEKVDSGVNKAQSNATSFNDQSNPRAKEASTGVGGGDASADSSDNTDQVAPKESTSQEPAPFAAAQALAAAAARSKPAKWRGLNNVKYGRHTPPSYMRQNPNQNQMAEMQMQMQNMQLNSQQQNYGQDMMYMNQYQPNAVSANQMNTNMSAAPSQVQSNVTVNQSTKKSKPQPKKPAAKLCGTCTKCKNLFPDSNGPSKMIFPTSSSHAIRQRNTRSLLNMGQQDAKNFRAIRYNNNS